MSFREERSLSGPLEPAASLAVMPRRRCAGGRRARRSLYRPLIDDGTEEAQIGSHAGSPAREWRLKGLKSWNPRPDIPLAPERAAAVAAAVGSSAPPPGFGLASLPFDRRRPLQYWRRQIDMVVERRREEP